MKSVEIDPDDRKSSKKASIAVDTFTPNGGAKYHKTRTRILTKSFKSEVKRVPRYGDVTMVRRNILTPDGEKLRFIPFLENDEDPVGRNGQRLQKELQSAYKTADNESSRDKEDPVRYDDTLFETGCQNVSIQRNVSKRLIIGESEIAGFGCYTAEAIRKGSFVSEYKGEIISNLEADRRGIVYDRKYLSFLFDLNSEWVIDAARFGNKTRYFNHAATTADGLNIEAKIYWVNGEHRIKFVALRDIEPGEELLFNYGKKFAEKHGLDKKLPKVRESTKKGVVTGEEALDLLDGVDKRRKDQRGVFAESGTGTGMARKQQKARKSAPNLGGSDEEAEEERIRLELEEAEDDEEDYEEGGPPRKSTRRRMRPLKYRRMRD
ncbi:putative Histone-lysine N-methyltransferase EZH2 [Glarea lozoyensis 74030]|uniref:Putative Histone-lysine N-methyltransferase EZH2 n=1 Tax=Glarea lozoyensis (strain ATCC 74030 / MF5533) TaxID=1104152 RepID=H0EIM4_GLAL7|nr:putative Histone-lysine N-methyltransferase EZH2 [Glarea lozoyensis 74030]